MVGYALPGTSVFPEGITEGPGTTFFVGSMADGGIYRGDTATGRIEMSVPPDGDGHELPGSRAEPRVCSPANLSRRLPPRVAPGSNSILHIQTFA